ncbi:hypothetical protein ACJ72_08467, partial [Emergomyces africanus]
MKSGSSFFTLSSARSIEASSEFNSQSDSSQRAEREATIEKLHATQNNKIEERDKKNNNITATVEHVKRIIRV